MEKKHILVLFPSINLYGKERSNYEVLKVLKNSDEYNITIIANKNATKELKERFSEFENRYIQIPPRTGTLRILRYAAISIWDNLKLAAYLLSHKVDCIYINNEMSIYDFYPVLKLFSTSIIYRIGDVPAFPTLTGYRINYFMWNSIVNKKASAVVSISNFIKSEIGKYGRRSDLDRVIYNFPPSRNEKVTIHPKVSSKNLKVGYLGQIVELKGVHVLVEAVLQMAEEGYNIELSLAGSTHVFEDYSRSLKKRIELSPKKGCIHFLEEISEITPFFNSIDILCVPTIWPEALGNVIVEAKQNHTPVVVFPSGGMPELIEEGIDGFICKDKTPESIKEVFLRYINDAELANKQSEKSFESLKRLRINYDDFSKSWLSVFRNSIEC
jgi:glycosyltransferase involved in cell wall biosynthesis